MERQSREVWAKRVERWRDSGLTSQEFAAEIGVNARTLTYWKWQLGREAKRGRVRRGDTATARKGNGRRSRREGAQPTFIEVAASVTDCPLELVVAGRTVRVRVGFDEDTLRRLVQVLEAQA